MTGFGKSTTNLSGKTVTIEIKSLNSKQLDLSLKLPPSFREKEADIRGIISKKLERGKIELLANIDYLENELPSIVNKPLVIAYYKELKGISDVVQVADSEILSAVFKFPDVLKPSRELLTETEWESIRKCLTQAIAELEQFRVHEGDLLQNDFFIRERNIRKLLNDLSDFEDNRNTQFREKLRLSVNEFVSNNTLDSNRFEQEIIYYLEKLDITEEKVRLAKHLDYFIETLKETEANGKKLSFITQEIGREINTIGSKANDANIQRVVVQMKDELEKIKEQLANIL